MGFGPVGSIRKQVMRQMRNNDKELNDLMKPLNSGYYSLTKTKSTNVFKRSKKSSNYKW